MKKITKIEDYIQYVTSELFESLGKKNIISIYLTGSVARNTATFIEKNEEFYLQSDLDFVVICSPKIILKSLLKIKPLSNKITEKLRKEKLLSHVSISVITESTLKNMLPTIFYQDFSNNGKLVYGRDLKEIFPKYKTKDIPSKDIYRLIFNRMTELLAALVNSKIFEKKVNRIDYDYILDHIGKFVFSIIQAILIKNEGILIYRGTNLKDIESNSIKYNNSKLIQELLRRYETFSEANRKKEPYTVNMIENFFVDIQRLTKLSIQTLSNSNNSSQTFIRQIFVEEERISERVKISLIIFLQYFKILKKTNLLRMIIYNIKYGPDSVYSHLYELFLQVPNVIHQHNLIKNKDSTADERHYQSIRNNEFVVGDWLDSFDKYYELWRIRSGF